MTKRRRPRWSSQAPLRSSARLSECSGQQRRASTLERQLEKSRCLASRAALRAEAPTWRWCAQRQLRPSSHPFSSVPPASFAPFPPPSPRASVSSQTSSSSSSCQQNRWSYHLTLRPWGRAHSHLVRQRFGRTTLFRTPPHLTSPAEATQQFLTMSLPHPTIHTPFSYIPRPMHTQTGTNQTGMQSSLPLSRLFPRASSA